MKKKIISCSLLQLVFKYFLDCKMKCEVIEWDGSLVCYFYYQAVSDKGISKAVMYSFIAKSSVFLVGRVAQSVYRLSYGLDGPGSNLGGDKIFRLSRTAMGPTQPPVQWLSGISRGVGLTPHPI